MKLKVIFALLFISLLMTCGNKTNRSTAGKDVSYTMAQGYFVKNTVAEGNHTLVFKSEEELNEYFGMASTMSSKPSSIDFSKQNVLAVIGNLTDQDTNIEIMGLTEEKGTFTLKYTIKIGEKLSYTMRPCLLVILDKPLESENQATYVFLDQK